MDGLFIFFVPENVGNLTIQGGAEGVQGFGRHGLALLDPVDRVRGKALFVDQVVFRDSFPVQGLEKRSISNQTASPKRAYHILSLDYA